MSDQNEVSGSDRAESLLNLYFDGILDETGFRELEALLVEYGPIRERYLELVFINESMILHSLETETTESSLENLLGSIGRQPSSKSVRSTSHAFPGWVTRIRIGIAVATAALLSIVSLGIHAWYSSTTFAPNRGLVGNLTANQPPASIASAEPAESESDLQSDAPHYIARLSKVSYNATWGKQQPDEFLFRFRKNEVLEIVDGMASIEFGGGTNLSLFGPTKLELIDDDSARLLAGRVSGNSGDGNFRLMTHSAEIVDSGKEFGVSIDHTEQVSISSFGGNVDVYSSENRTTPIRLNKGMGARVALNGKVVFAESESPKRFSWLVEEPKNAEFDPNQISLADIIAGGNGSLDFVAGAIDPQTGEIDRNPVRTSFAERHRLGESTLAKTFHLNVSSPYLDGTFIPQKESSAVINSNGDLFDFGTNSGATWGPIWARRHVRQLLQAGSSGDFWGNETMEAVVATLDKSKLGLVGIHPNVGITIDLQALRQDNDGQLKSFSAVLQNLDNSATRLPQWTAENTADFRVIVDGEVRFERLGFGVADGKITVHVELKESDRFFTLAATDAGNTNSFDHVVLVDAIFLGETISSDQER